MADDWRQGIGSWLLGVDRWHQSAGSWMSDVDNWINRSAIPTALHFARPAIPGSPDVEGAWNQFNNKLESDAAANPAPDSDPLGLFFGQNRVTLEGLSEVDKAVRAVPVVGPVGGFLLDLPNRSYDTYANVGQSALYRGSTEGYGGLFSEILNKDSWNKAWNSWGQQDHLSAGTVVSNLVTGDDTRLKVADPFAAAEAQAIQASAHENWYGELMGAAVDLSAGFAVPAPGAGFLKAARAAKVPGVAQVEKMAATWNAADDATRAGFKSSKVADTVRTRFGGEASTESLIDQMVNGIRKTDNIHDRATMSNVLDPWMEGATEAAKADLADLFVEANKHGDMATHLKVNTMLAAMGSGTAKAELRNLSPLLLRQMENVSTSPEVFGVADAIVKQRLKGGAAEYDTGRILDSFYDTAGAKAEVDALRQQLLRDRAVAKKTKKLRDEFTPSGGDRMPNEASVAFDSADVRANAALAEKKVSQSKADWQAAKANLKDLEARRAATRPGVDVANDFLARVWGVGEEGAMMTGRVAPSRLDALKTAYRQQVGEQYLYRTADAQPNVFVHALPVKTMSSVGTPRMRGFVNLAEPTRGARELMEGLKRSKVYQPEEIRAAGDQLIKLPAHERGGFLERLQDDMLGRIAEDFGHTKDDALLMTQAAKQNYMPGRDYLSKAVQEAEGSASEVAMVRGADGELHAHNTAMLKSHLQDNAWFIDPTEFRNGLRAAESSKAGALQRGVNFMDNANRAFQGLWKHSVLMRPGLGTRAMLDTELRAVALVGAATQFVNGVNGARKLAAKGGASGLSRIGLRKGDGLVGSRAMGLDGFEVPIGGGATAEFRAVEDAAMIATERMAATKGGSYHGALLGSANKFRNQLQVNRNRWDMYKAEDPRWPLAYSEHAQQLLASPTGRALMKDITSGPAEIPSIEASVRELFQDQKIAAEYDLLARPQGISKADFVYTVADEVSRMFPTEKIAKDITSGALRKGGKTADKWVEESFPAGQRFDVPGPESLLAKNGLAKMSKTAVERFYNVVLDAPDFWMARHPVFVKKFQRAVADETAGVVKAKGYADAADLRTIDARARTAAMTQVRNTFFDTTRYTGTHHYLSKISPFFNAWEDALISWSRLLYDDPTRGVRMSGAWNSFANVSPWLPAPEYDPATGEVIGSPLPLPIFVDGNGKVLARGEESDNGKYILLPLAGKFGLQDIRINQEAFNSIAQGGVAWLPGFGPTTQAATTEVLSRMVPTDVALDLVGTDNWFGKQLLNSMYLDGELPREGDVAKSLFPAWMRNLHSDIMGDNFAANIATLQNRAYLDAQARGEKVDYDAVHEEATKAAWSAALVRLVQQGGVGLSGRAAVEGQFYVDQMHQINALSEEQLKGLGYQTPEEMFADKFPDAARLDWRLSRNETGINATVNAQKSAYANRGLISKYPDMGWFVVGDQNVGGEFSRTAYNMQQDTKYGRAQLGRVKESPQEAERGAIVSQGWDQYTKMTLQLEQKAAEYGASDKVVSAVRASFVDWLAKQNTDWFQEYSERKNKLAVFYNEADLIAEDPSVRDRPDIQAYRDYRAAREEVLAAANLKSLTGTSEKSAKARFLLRRMGEDLAARDLGFKQMWDRMMSSEVDPLSGDSDLLGGAASGEAA